MSYSLNGAIDDCYEGTTCLINKFDVKDETVLKALETAITLEKLLILESGSIEGIFDVEYYKNIHRFLFEDLFDWAGEYRKINISKKGTVFSDFNQIDELMNNCFSRLRNMNYYSNIPFDEFVLNIVDLYCTTNIIHPFREGNGRTQRIFISQLIRYNGYDINFSDIDADELMIATIHAANGVKDYLIEIFAKNIKKLQVD